MSLRYHPSETADPIRLCLPELQTLLMYNFMAYTLNKFYTKKKTTSIILGIVSSHIAKPNTSKNTRALTDCISMTSSNIFIIA